jgi:putative flippase GtrA
MNGVRIHPVDSVFDRVKGLFKHHQVRYLLVAGCTSLGYLALVAIGYQLLGWHYMVAILAAQVITICTAFWFYRGFVFQSKGTVWVDFVRFLSVWSTGAIAGIVGTPFLVEVFGMHPLVAQVLAIIIVAVGSYLGHTFFSFRNRDPQSAKSDEVQP